MGTEGRGWREEGRQGQHGRVCVSSLFPHPSSIVTGLLLFLCSLLLLWAPCAGAAPYPDSAVLKDVVLDWSTHDRRAPGSDNWPVTWADNDHQYTSWGDGGGFGGTNSNGRVSLGVARVEGSATSHQGFNVFGGVNPERPAAFGGKSYGILSVDGTLYLWVSPGSDTTGYAEARLYSSSDHGRSWSRNDWAFTKDDGVIFPTFLQFGRDDQDSRDGFVYVYASHLQNAGALSVQKPGEMTLMRVPKDTILVRSAYTFFNGLDAGGNALWTADCSNRAPVFRDANGVGWNVSAAYNAGLNRYVLVTEHNVSNSGDIGMFDAPEPWGPWTTVLYTSDLGGDQVPDEIFFANFSNKWTSADGRDFTLIFTGTGESDSWNTVDGRFIVRGPALIGDVDGDGDTDLADLRLLIRMLVGQIPQDLAMGDLDNNGTLGLGDIRALIRLLVRP